MLINELREIAESLYPSMIDFCQRIIRVPSLSGETVESAIAEIQDVIDDLSAEDPEFKATVEINANVRSSYTGRAEQMESQKEAWIIEGYGWII